VGCILAAGGRRIRKNRRRGRKGAAKKAGVGKGMSMEIGLISFSGLGKSSQWDGAGID